MQNAFGEFLTAQRARVSPQDVGLPTAGSRRVKVHGVEASAVTGADPV